MKQKQINILFEELLSPHTWFQFPLRLVQNLKLPLDEAVILAYLIGTSQKHKAYERTNGWFYCKATYIMETFSISEYTQTRIVKNLVTKKLIKIRHGRNPKNHFIPRRLIKILICNIINPTIPKPAKGSIPLPAKGSIVHRHILDPSGHKADGKPHSFLIACCQQLKDAVHQGTNTIIKWRNEKQASYFKSLLSSIKNDEDRFLDVLEWYCTKLKNKEVRSLQLPLCVSPKEFKDRWSWIEERYKKHSPREQSADVEITQEAKGIYDRLSMKTWPKGSKDQLLNLVQTGLNEYKAFRSKLKKFAEKYVFSESKRKLQSFAEHCQLALPPGTVLIENWYRELNNNIHHWNGWQGDLYNHRFTIENKKFQQLGKSLSIAYSVGSNDKLWNDLMEALDAK